MISRLKADLHERATLIAEGANNGFYDFAEGEIRDLAKGYLDLRKRTNQKRVCHPSIRLQSGGWYDFEKPEESDYSERDIAYALSKIARMNGHNLNHARGYPVAQHCYIGSLYAKDCVEAFEFLMHDAPEFVMGDMTTPLKQLCPDYQYYYHLCEADMARRYRLPYPMTRGAKVIDMRMFATEARDMMHVEEGTDEWELLKGIEPFDFKVVEWTAEHAAEAWLERFYELCPHYKEIVGVST